MLTGYDSTPALEALAAACAESQKFAEAVDCQAKANLLLTDLAAKQQGQARLKLYREKRPYRD